MTRLSRVKGDARLSSVQAVQGEAKLSSVQAVQGESQDLQGEDRLSRVQGQGCSQAVQGPSCPG